MLRSRVVRAALVLAAALLFSSLAVASDAAVARIVTHDNRIPAGTLKNGTLTIDLEMKRGEWYPEADDGPHIGVYAFAEAGKAPMIPGPLLRVPEGTRILLSVKNLLAEPMVLHGWFTRPGTDMPEPIAPGETKEFAFTAGAPGTYFYWAGAATSTMVNGSTRYTDETQLSGALVVDGPTARADERIFVIGVWRDYQDRENPTLAGLREFGTINGKAWPYTERLQFRTGEEVIWHWVNATPIVHPMHMHGSFYEVLSRGDWQRGTPLLPEMRPRVVTELMRPGTTMSTRWVPAAPGHWLFHCHLMAHLEPKNSLSAIQQRTPDHAAGHSGMVGLVLALDVEGVGRPVPAAYRAARKLRMEIEPVHGEISITLRDGRHLRSSEQLLGPPIVLRRGEPTEITVVNHLAEPTSIHWHGMELESYYDGVPGLTGSGKQITPRIEPGGKFVVRMTPPRAGTFIYHTHWHDIDQLRRGLNGALLVIDDGYDPSSEQVFVTSFGPNDELPLLLNGSGTPSPLRWSGGRTYRLRFINIGPNIPVLLSVLSDGKPLRWKGVGKDGMELPLAQRVEGPSVQLVAVGETYDYEMKAPPAGDLTVRAFIASARGIAPQLQVEQVIHIQSSRTEITEHRELP